VIKKQTGERMLTRLPFRPFRVAFLAPAAEPSSPNLGLKTVAGLLPLLSGRVLDRKPSACHSCVAIGFFASQKDTSAEAPAKRLLSLRNLLRSLARGRRPDRIEG